MKKLLFLTVSAVFMFFGNLEACADYYDSFDGSGNIVWQVQTGVFSIDDSERCLADSASDINRSALATMGISVDSAIIRLTFQAVSGIPSNAFLVFGYRNNLNYYLIGARSDTGQWVLEQIKDGERITLAGFSEEIAVGVDYAVRVSLLGEDITFSVDGAQKFAYTLTSMPSGDLGLAVDNAASYFDDISISSSAAPAVPATMRFQARLGDSEGAPLDGVFNLTFRLYDADTSGTPAWEEIQQGVSIEDGVVDVELGSITPIDVTFDRLYWLGVEVEDDGEMTPRFKLASVPYSFSSAH